MGFPISAGLLDSMVLSVVDREDTYGYEITQFIRSAVDVSESTLYPVLKRLQKNDLLETYDKEFLKPVQVEALKNYPNLSNVTQFSVISIMNDALPKKSKE